MKILILTNYYPEGPSSRYRSFNYKKYFETVFDVEYKPLFFDGYVRMLYSNQRISLFSKIKCVIKRIVFVLFNKNLYDHIIIETEIAKYLPFWIEKMLLIRKSYSLDYDDNPNFTYRSRAFLRSLYGNKINKLARGAKFVTVGNKWYFEEIKSGNLVYLPTVVDIEKYKCAEHTPKDTVTIVWIGSPSTAKYLEIIRQPLEGLRRKYRFKLRIIGADIKFDFIETEFLKWSGDKESEWLAECDIGIMPLQDSYFEKGKCGFKLIQYMAAGLPAVASSSPANNEIIDAGQTGYIAETTKEWECYLEVLLTDRSLREQIGKNARKKVERQYCYQVQNKKYISHLQN